MILSPHVDDGVLGCAGTLSKLSEDRNNVFDYIVFSPTSHEFDHETLHNELITSLNYLGLSSDSVHYCDFETRFFPRDRQKILDFLYKLSKEKSYDWVFTPSTYDVHQDHEVVTRELLRIYKRLNVSIFGYELILNQFSFRTSAFFGFSKINMDAKLNAFNCFQSQMFRKHFDSELFYSAARVRGAQMGAKYAEAFEVLRAVMNKSGVKNDE